MEGTPLTRAQAEMERRRQEIASEFRQILDNPKGKAHSLEQIKYLSVLYGLVHQTVTAYSQLWDSASEKNVMYCAFNTRNLLELMIWSDYCCVSLENGLRFAEDTVRDYAGMLVAIRELATVWDDKKSLAEVAQLLADHAVSANAHGMDTEDHRYFRVAMAAKELGPQVELSFKYINNVISKFVHPTAFVVNNAAFPQWDDDFAKKVISEMFSMGVSDAEAILNRIATKVVSLNAQSDPGCS
jgi:hypothetical protein